MYQNIFLFADLLYCCVYKSKFFNTTGYILYMLVYGVVYFVYYSDCGYKGHHGKVLLNAYGFNLFNLVDLFNLFDLFDVY